MSLSPELLAVVVAGSGVATFSQLRAVASRRTIQGAHARGDLIRLHPQTYATPASASDPWTRVLAAVTYAGEGCAVSHTSALVVHGVLGEDHLTPVHVTMPLRRERVSAPGAEFHRSRLVTSRATRARPATVPRGMRVITRRDLPVLALEGSLVTAWPLLPPATARSSVMTAMRQRMTKADRMSEALVAIPGLAGGAELRRLLHLVATGCHSPLEVFGLLHVFRHPDMPKAEHQYAVSLGARNVYLDVAYPELLLNVELDGRDWHGGIDAERDRRRDLSLAGLGWQTLRISAARLFADPEGVRREILAVYRARAQLMRLRVV